METMGVEGMIYQRISPLLNPIPWSLLLLRNTIMVHTVTRFSRRIKAIVARVPNERAEWQPMIKVIPRSRLRAQWRPPGVFPRRTRSSGAQPPPLRIVKRSAKNARRRRTRANETSAKEQPRRFFRSFSYAEITGD